MTATFKRFEISTQIKVLKLIGFLRSDVSLTLCLLGKVVFSNVFSLLFVIAIHLYVHPA